MIKTIILSPESLFEIAREAMYGYDQDWTPAKDHYLKLVCIELIDKFQTLQPDQQFTAAISSVATLMVENHFLNRKLC